jgi:diguanylate cyclase (GGDEF)-like protein/PAS domain S-box-containing protein
MYLETSTEDVMPQYAPDQAPPPDEAPIEPDTPFLPATKSPDGEIDPTLTRAIVDTLSDGVYFVDPTRRITYWNRGAEQISGYDAPRVVGHRCYENILNHVDGTGQVLCHTACPLARTILDGKPREALVWLKHRDGHRKPVRLRTSQVRDAEGHIIGGLEIFHDESELTEITEEAARARRDAVTDTLTGLPNRRFFDASLATRLENMARYGWDFGLLIVDIDHFKKVNDVHGHAFGDDVLRVVSRTLHGAVRAGDVIARWGGEEFAVLVETSDRKRLVEAAERLRVLVERSEVFGVDARHSVTVSVGGALATAADSAGSLFDRADEAVRDAKQAGRNRISIA